MKNILIALLILCTTGFIHAQKLGIVDSQAVLEKMPAYTAAQEKIETVSSQWQEELERKYKEIEKKYKEYEAEVIILPDDVKKQRQDEIFELERKAKKYKEDKFGFEGELYKLQEEELQPVQDQVFEAIKKVAQQKKLNIVIDASSDSAGIIYNDGVFDRTQDVMALLGIQDN